MKLNVSILLVAGLIFTGCAKQTTVSSPTGTAVVAATAVLTETGCIVASADTSATVSAWLTQECPVFVSNIVDLIYANGTLAKLQAAVTAMQASFAAIPAGTLGPNDAKYITQVLALAQAAINAYAAASGQTASLTPPLAATLMFGSPLHWHPPAYTKAEKAKLKAIRKRAHQLKAAHAQGKK